MDGDIRETGQLEPETAAPMGDQGVVCALALVMQRLGNQLLACPCFPQDEYGCIGFSNLQNLFQNTPQRLTLTNDISEVNLSLLRP